MTEYQTLGDFAKQFQSLPLWKLRRLYERKLLPEPPRIGGKRVISADSAPLVIETLRRVGYLSPEETCESSKLGQKLTA